NASVAARVSYPGQPPPTHRLTCRATCYRLDVRPDRRAEPVRRTRDDEHFTEYRERHERQDQHLPRSVRPFSRQDARTVNASCGPIRTWSSHLRLWTVLVRE